VRIINVSSIAHNFGIPPEGISWDTVGPNADMAKRKKVGTMDLYSQSKLVSPFTLLCRRRHTRRRQGIVLITNELARRVGDKNIVAVSLHPGNINSSPEQWNIIVRILLRLAFYDISYGVISPLYAGTAPTGAELNGKVTKRVLVFGVNANVLALVPDCVGTCDASKREGPRCGATEEVMGMVRGPSEGLVILWIAYAFCGHMAIEVARTGTSQWGWSDTPTGDSVKWAVGRGPRTLCSADH